MISALCCRREVDVRKCNGLVRDTMILNTEFWAESVLGGLLRDFSNFFAHIQFEDPVRQCCGSNSHTLWPSDGFAICAVSRHGHFIVGDWTSSSPRNGANRKRLATFPFQPLAVALFQYLRQSTRCACSPNLSLQSITLRRATLG